ncbi:MAG: thioredoxin [Lactovum sp.]
MEYIATDANFKEEIATGTVLVDFWAERCGPCRMQAPILEKLSEELEESELKILKMNIDEEPETAQSFGIMSIPTLMFIKDGKVAKQVAGVHNKQQILSILSEIDK